MIHTSVGNTGGNAGSAELAAAEPRVPVAYETRGLLGKLGTLVEKHAQPAHDEDAYYNPPPRPNPWEGVGYLVLAVTAGVAGCLLWASLGA